MMSSVKRKLGVLGASLAVLATTTALAGVPYPTPQTPAPVDRGLLRDIEANKPITVTIVLKLRDLAGAEALMQRQVTETDPQFHKFLTPAQFVERFGPTAATVERVSSSLTRLGLSVRRATSTTLSVTGTPVELERAFKVNLHQFEVPAVGKSPSYVYRAPLERPTMPAEIASLVHPVLGLDTRPAFRPHLKQASGPLRPAKAVLKKPASGTAPPDEPGFWTVTDFADYYDVTPLYTANITGVGRTIGIVTFASFTESDAYTYWSNAGLTVSQNRISVSNVDGGSGAPSDLSGSDETTLDVEQSGGISSGASIIVYEAPNTNQAFVDAFAAAIDDNKADTISVSWGDWEWYNTLANSPVTDPGSGKTVGILTACHELFVQAGVQGESMFAAAGDAGAYDANDQAAPPDFSLALSVDYPASDSAITAAGGTTVPATLDFTVPNQPDVTVTIPTERVWGWDYLVPLCTALGYDPVNCGILPVGGGGGVSIHFAVPSYQVGETGLKLTHVDQVLLDEDTVPPTTVLVLPAAFAGRNVPDVSLNADPETGYVLTYTSDQSGFGNYAQYGGTSFVAPQLNGVTSLLSNKAGSRLGLINKKLYNQSRKATGYGGSAPPLRAIDAGNNDFYKGTSGYNPAAGVGAIDVANLAAVTK
jgi:subtilase family serine protease